MIKTIWTDNLIKVLEYENKLYRRLLKMAEEKTGTVINGELEKLQQTLGKEQQLVSELNQLQKVREQILEQIGKELDKKPDAFTMTDIIDCVPGDCAVKLTEIRRKLQDTIGKLMSKNDLNQKLIQNALEYVDFSLNLLTQPGPKATQYGRRGNEEESGNRGMVDIKY